jgi:protein-disulfide isomerase
MTSLLKPPVNDRDHVEGPPDATLTLLEFGDYQCPFCGRAYYVIKAMEQLLGDRLRFAFRNFPLASLHRYSVLAAEAAEAAAAQGRYWPMHDRLFEHQDALDLADVTQYAADLGLDLEMFESDLRTHRFLDRVRVDLHSGAMSGVNGTPTFFLNGRRHEGSWDFDSLWATIAGQVGAGQAI